MDFFRSHIYSRDSELPMHTINVISLKRSKERREEFSKLNSHLKFTFYDSVDGSKLTERKIKNSKLFRPNLGYTSGAYGNAMSHLSLWEKVIKSKEIMTIAEDDSIFRLDFEEKHQEVLEKMPSDWDIILWGWNFDSILSVNVLPNISPVVVLCHQDKLRGSIVEFQSVQEEASALKLSRCFGTHAYSISPKGAKKFKSLCFPLSGAEVFFPMLGGVKSTGIDNAMNQHYDSNESFCCFPPLAVTKNERSKSEVQNKKFA